MSSHEMTTSKTRTRGLMELTILPFRVFTVWLMSQLWVAMMYSTVLFAGKVRPIMTLQCRFYANRFPEVDDVVMVNVRSVAEMGVYVTLLEYDNIEAMIPLSELSRRRIRSINKLIRVNSNEAVVVIRVDENKGYIDLSKRRVSHEEVLKCEENFAKGKAVNSILRHVGELLQYKTGKELDELYQKTAWMFDEKYKKQGAAYEAFKHSVTNPEILDECDIDDNTRETLITNIKRRLSPQSVKLRADIELVCTNYEGIDAIKRALRKGLEVSTEDLPIKINLISPPLFVITTQTLAQVEGLVALNEAIVAIKSSIEDEGGLFNLKLQPKIMCDHDEDNLMKQLQGVDDDGGVSDGDDDKDSDSSNSDDPDGSI